ncbi:MAG: hypothetical protein CMJ41_08025 [Phycisphaerae bacterium]|nr:hypothetical protein [Phycisphaerae bacterium]HBZ96828.1 hypothetical protein [Phycisphaerales bacterium]
MVRHVRRTINQLIQEYEDMPTRDSRDALLKAIFNLNAWYSIELGNAEDRPFCIAWEDGDPVLLVFTDERRADRALHTWLGDHVDTCSSVRRIRVAELDDFLTELDRWGIRAIRFNHGPWSVRFELGETSDAARSYASIETGSIDRLVGQALQGSAAEDDIWSRILDLGSWYFVSDVADNDDPLIWIMHDEPCVLVFTDERHARAYAVEQGLEGCTTDVGRLIEVDPESAMKYMKKLVGRGVSGAMFNHGPYGFYTPLGRLCRQAA